MNIASLMATGSSFIPLTNLYTAQAGPSFETIPLGATQVIIEVWGQGGNGGPATGGAEPSFGHGGGASGYSKKTLVLTSLDWGTTINYTNSTTSTVTRAGLNLIAHPGQDGTATDPGVGGDASGGDVNTTGATASIGASGAQGTQGTLGPRYGSGGRGQIAISLPFSEGDPGAVSFQYT